MRVAGVGRVIFWQGGSLWTGMAVTPVGFHAHHAIQIGVGLSGPVQFRSRSDANWIEGAAAVIPSNLPHAFQAPRVRVAFIFCEPESAIGRRIARRFGSSAIAGLPADLAVMLADPLAHAYGENAPDERLEELSRQALLRLSDGVEAGIPTDARVAEAIRAIRRRLDQPLTLGEIAGAVGLSEGRFRHLFVKETGMAFRAFVLWARLNRALELGFGGASWTEAAHAANFADAARLTRTCRRMSGIAPSSLRRDEPRAPAGKSA